MHGTDVLAVSRRSCQYVWVCISRRSRLTEFFANDVGKGRDNIYTFRSSSALDQPECSHTFHGHASSNTSNGGGGHLSKSHSVGQSWCGRLLWASWPETPSIGHRSSRLKPTSSVLSVYELSYCPQSVTRTVSIYRPYSVRKST